MALLPIDLQAVFAQLNQVGAEQGNLREAATLHQSLQGADLASRTQHQDHAVNESRGVGDDGVEGVNEEAQGQDRQSGQPRQRQKKEDPPAPRGTFQDPDLGRHIDIKG